MREKIIPISEWEKIKPYWDIYENYPSGRKNLALHTKSFLAGDCYSDYKKAIICQNYVILS